MAAKLKYLLLIVFLFGFQQLLIAQSATQFPAHSTAGSFISTDGSEPRYMQRFVWSSEYAAMYEVVFYKLENDAYVPFIREFTALNYIELSLPVGSYCFIIIPYDILDKPGTPSDWRYIDVIPAPGTEDLNEQITQPVNEFESVKESEKETFTDQEQGFFTETQIEEESNPFALKPVLISVNLSWMPIIPVYGDAFGENISLIAVNARLTAVFKTPLNIYIGAEIFAAQNTDLEDISAGLNFVGLKWFPCERAAAGIKFGAAVPVSDSETENITANTGLFFRLRVSKNILFELGIDISHKLFDNFSGCLRPWIGLGYQF